MKKRKYKIVVNNKLRGSYGAMNPETNKIEINLRAHKKNGKIDKANLASTIKHELMHVNQPHKTEKEVYKATAKTKIPPMEQHKLIAKLRNKSINYKVGALKRKYKLTGDTQPGDIISQMNSQKSVRKSKDNLSLQKIEIMGIM